MQSINQTKQNYSYIADSSSKFKDQVSLVKQKMNNEFELNSGSSSANSMSLTQPHGGQSFSIVVNPKTGCTQSKQLLYANHLVKI